MTNSFETYNDPDWMLELAGYQKHNDDYFYHPNRSPYPRFHATIHKSKYNPISTIDIHYDIQKHESGSNGNLMYREIKRIKNTWREFRREIDKVRNPNFGIPNPLTVNNKKEIPIKKPVSLWGKIKSFLSKIIV